MSRLSHLLAGALLPLGVVSTAFAAPAPIKLYDLPTSRFVEKAGGEVWAERGLLAADGSWRLVSSEPVLSTVVVPAHARNRQLVTIEQWLAYSRLGPDALANYVGEVDIGIFYVIGAREYIDVAARPGAKLDDGKLINVATRGQATAAEKLIGGFVITEQSRRVLVRAIGPALTPLGVTNALADPKLTIYRSDAPAGAPPVDSNGDWSLRADAATTAQAAVAAGAFPLTVGSKDAAVVIELTPGAYTVQVEPETGAGGVALVEVYRLP
jgi:hypothetical protein